MYTNRFKEQQNPKRPHVSFPYCLDGKALTRNISRMSRIFCLLMFFPLLSISQPFDSAQVDKGIKWTTGLSWDQIKQKAKKENKYIFIDVYTTWCGPCKMLDKTVFINDTVGAFFNQHFISVKVQMDRTKKDDEYIRSWYETANRMNKEYIIEGYPTAIFLSPDAKIVHKDGGFKPVQGFISMAKLALTPGKVYEDPYDEYKRLVNEYKQGIKYYDRMAEMVKTAFKLNDGGFARELLKDHENYASTLNKKQRYTKENVEVWSSFILNPGSKAFGFFIKDGDKIDKVMNQQGYSREIVDKSIQSTIVDSFFRMQKGETKIVTGTMVPNSEVMFMKLPVIAGFNPGSTDPSFFVPGTPDYVEANWKQLESMIRKHFSKDYAARNVLAARTRWYKQHLNMDAASKAYFTQIDKWPPLYLDIPSQNEANEVAWYTFLNSNDEKLLKTSVMAMEKLIKKRSDRHELLDTYASLLYKLGRVNEAIQWEEKAIVATKLEGYHKIYRDVIEKMKKGEPTYLDQGAIWPTKK